MASARMRVHEVSTPAVVVDLDVLERNLDRMAAYCRDHGLALRPHTKTHKTPEVAKLQLDRGAIGLTVAKVGEAEVMAQASPREILVAHPILGEAKLRRLAALPAHTDILVALDSLEAAQALSQVARECGRELAVLVEFDSGSRRCGVASRDCAALGEAIARLPNVTVRGLMTYFGSVWGDEQQRSAEMERVQQHVAEAIDSFRRARLPLAIVSAGSTPAAWSSHRVPGITEIRPGTYVYNDLNTYYQGLCELNECAVRVLTTVVSTSVPGQVVVDAGSKVFSSDPLGAGPKQGFGMILEAPGAVMAKLNEEHGYVQGGDAADLRLGRVLSVIPNHVCTCINMHDAVLLARGGEIVGSWQVVARGKVC